MNTFINKTIIIVFLGLFSLGTLAKSPLASKQQIGMFLNSTTCVVLENNNISGGLYNACIKEAVQKYWKSTTFEFIDQNEFNFRRYNSKYSFLVMMKVVYDKDPAGVSYNYISLVLGDTTKDMTKMPEFCSIPLSYSSDNSLSYEYALPYIVKFMQKHVQKLEQKRFWISLSGLKYYNSTAPFKEKVLLLNKDMLAKEINTSEKIKGVYPHQFKLVSVLEMKTELAKNSSNVLFNFHVGSTSDSEAGRCFDMIFDLEGNLVYYNDRKITNDNKDGFNQKDLSMIK